MSAKLPHIARILLGVVFFGAGVFGLIGIINHQPPPPDLPEALATYMKGLEASVYFMPFLKITETVCGLMLLSNRFVALALVILAPISINIFLVHAFMMPKGLPLAVIIGLLMIYLSFFAQPYSITIKQLFKSK